MFPVLLALLFNVATPTLIGRVTDATGRPIARAQVRLISVEGAGRNATTDDRGGFRFEVMGRFQLQIEHPGYRSVQTLPASLPSDGLYQVQISMDTADGKPPDQVELRISVPQDIESRSDPSAREGLPKSDRLFGLKGGVNVSGIKEGSAQQWVAASGNVFTSSSMATGVGRNPDFSADLGDSTAADDALPAGGDTFHGNIHGFHRNDRLNAKNYFDLHDLPTPPFKYNFFGGDTGGRLGEATYLYTQYWGLRIRQSITRAATVPKPAWLSGDFSDLPDTLVDPENGFPFLGNRIPKDRFNRTGFALAQLYPASNVPGGSAQDYRAVAKVRTAADAFGFRLDRRLTLADEAFVEYQFNRDTTDDPFNLLSGITNLPFFGVRDALQTHSLRLNNTHVFSSSLVHQLRLSVAALNQPRTILESAVQPAVIVTGGLSYVGHATNLPQRRRNRSYELLNDVAWQRKSGATKVGVELRYFPFQASMDLYSRGQYQFTGNIFSGHAFANLLLGLPSNALRIQGNTSRDFRTWMSSVHVQRDWQLRRGISVNTGLRYDYQSPFREAQGRVATFDPSNGSIVRSPKRLYNPDRNNFSPRFGIAWQPAVRDTLVRAGYGIFYDTLAVGDSLFLLGLNPPFVQFDVENNGPVVPLFNVETAFANATGSIHPSIFSAAPNLPNPYVQQWNVAVERLLPWKIVIELGYYGQKGTRLRRQLNLNQPAAGPLGTLDDRRPYAAFRNIFQFETSASSIAHAADLRASRRFGRSSVEAIYRFSRLIDDATLISVLPQNSHDLRAERGLADFHMKHRLSFQLTANLIEGWQLHGLGLVQSGTPLSAVLGADVAGTGSPIVNRPNLIRNPNVADPAASRFFDPDAFQIPDPGRFGTSGRNAIIGPGIKNMDLALSRAFRVSDFTRLQFRADAYNVFNHPNFVAPPSMQNFADSPDFGQLFVARSPRILQFGLKFLW